jgi:hypothetical protein
MALARSPSLQIGSLRQTQNKQQQEKKKEEEIVHLAKEQS